MDYSHADAARCAVAKLLVPRPGALESVGREGPGESGTSGVRAAVANAVADAVGAARRSPSAVTALESRRALS